METHDHTPEFPYLPPDFPRDIYKEIYAVTGRTPATRDVPLFKNEFNSLAVWHTLRTIYIYFRSRYKPFTYTTDFSEYEKFGTLEIIEHLRAILDRINVLQNGVNTKNTMGWEHFGVCDIHFKFYLQFVDAFLEAVQGLSFTDRYDQRMKKFYEQMDRTIGGSVDKIMADYAEQSGLKPLTYQFSPEQSRIIHLRSTEWGEKRTAEFMAEKIIPLIIENPHSQLSTEKLIALIAEFEHTNN